MNQKAFILALLLLLLAAPAIAQQNEEKPSVWLISFYPYGPTDVIQTGMLDSLEAYGFINPDDRPEWRLQNTFELGEDSPIEFKRVDAGFDLGKVREVVAKALDHDPDVLVTISAPITLAALQATYDLESPPAIFFADVYNPYAAGIADAPCIKLDHVTGVESVVDYEELARLPLLQNPDINTIGTVHNSSDAGGAYGAGLIAEAGEALGLTVQQEAVPALSDLAFATEGLINKGAEAILLPMDYSTLAGLPLIVQVAFEQGIPVFTANFDGILLGALAGGGFAGYFDQGSQIGLMAAAYLQGELDPARVGISALTGELAVGINTIAAENQGFSFSQDLQDRADFAWTVSEDGVYDARPISARSGAEFQRFMGAAEPLEARQERDRAFLAEQTCTAERIAEQQAELDATEG